MGRSFLIRRGERLDIDFSKLYFEGDLSQNVYLEPQDYIYLASNLENQYFVFGAVARPGAQGLANEESVVSAVTRREGFTPASWKKRVLVVRGRLSEPETFMVDVSAILKGRERDFLIQPGDIVYVHNKPWFRAEQILNMAIQSYIRSAASAWTNREYPEPFFDPYL